MKKIKAITSKKIIVAIVFLVIMWTIVSILFLNKSSFSLVTYRQTNNLESQLLPIDSHEEVIYQGEFQARDNNLGLIVLPLSPHNLLNHSNTDLVTFSFKEKKDRAWTFRRDYSIRLFDNQSRFAFGLPIISHSKNTTYQFELSSTVTGTGNDTVEVKKNESFVTGYQYSKQEIQRHVATFLVSKIIGALTDSEFLAKLVIQIILLVFLFYSLLFLFLKLKKTIRPLRVKKASLRFPELLHYIEYIRNSTQLLNSTYTLTICFSLIVLWLLIIPFSLDTIQNLLNVLVYVLLVIGCIQIFFESRNYEKKKN